MFLKRKVSPFSVRVTKHPHQFDGNQSHILIVIFHSSGGLFIDWHVQFPSSLVEGELRRKIFRWYSYINICNRHTLLTFQSCYQRGTTTDRYSCKVSTDIRLQKPLGWFFPKFNFLLSHTSTHEQNQSGLSEKQFFFIDVLMTQNGKKPLHSLTGLPY